MNNLRTKFVTAPDTAGVYLMRDKAGRIIYIGKANSLRKRLMSYLGKDLSSKTIALMSHVEDIEFKLCPNESLALLLEASLVHKHKPRYNVSLRDDKSFPYVKITNETFPRLYITRKKEADGADYIGPYTNAKLLKGALKIIRHSFPFRSCKTLPRKPCMYYRLNLSPAPCVGLISKLGYAKLLNNIRTVLNGRADTLIQKLSKQMSESSGKLDFEAAAKIRDQINALSSIGKASLGLNSQDEIEDLKKLLNLSRIPKRIEAFDISNISGQEATGSMVSFIYGRPDKNNYRRFRIKGISGIDDYGMIAEVVLRRYQRLVKEKLSLPDLILIDGGRAHLLTAEKQLCALNLNIPLVSIAKEEEHIYTQGRIKPIKLKIDTPALNLIRRIRDEAHRFAVSYHHILRRKKFIGR
ncbi:MAG: excinuclease ABC subunit UvrC [Candidatus Omnitrophica bacterium]|nr:excinuclease ABC subunit UvrC [Candidatus Omnitrophota bacterium]